MANGRHSYVAFYPSDWLAGTHRLSRMHQSAFFDICCYTWDTTQPCPPSVLASMLSDIKGWRDIVQDLIDMGKLVRNDDGSVSNAKAMAEAEKAYRAWKAMSDGGKGAGRGRSKGACREANMGVDSAPNREPEPEPDVIEDKPLSQPRKRGSRLKADWLPGEYPVSIADLVSQWPAGREDRELDGFRDYWTSRQRDAAKLDWDRTWHNRIRDVHDRIMRENGNGGYRNGNGAGSGRRDGFGNALARAEAFFEARDNGSMPRTGRMGRGSADRSG